jgi:hypothetical protein
LLFDWHNRRFTAVLHRLANVLRDTVCSRPPDSREPIAKSTVKHHGDCLHPAVAL